VTAAWESPSWTSSRRAWSSSPARRRQHALQPEYEPFRRDARSGRGEAEEVDKPAGHGLERRSQLREAGGELDEAPLLEVGVDEHRAALAEVLQKGFDGAPERRITGGVEVFGVLDHPERPLGVTRPLEDDLLEGPRARPHRDGELHGLEVEEEARIRE
jgi:hypothetical protein